MSSRVIGDGAMSAGMAYEAMNNAGALDARLIVILNDNDMSIAPPAGAMSAYLAAPRAPAAPIRSLREIAKQLAKRLPKFLAEKARRSRNMRAASCTGGTLFEELGFYYVGPIDGHNLDHLLPVLKNVRDDGDGPVLVHVVTQKGKGYAPAEAVEPTNITASVKFDVITGAQAKPPANAPSLHARLRRQPDRGGRARTTGSWPSPRRCRPAPASTSSARFSRRAPSMSASPSSMPSPSPPASRPKG